MTEILEHEATSRPNHHWRTRSLRHGQPYRNWREIIADVSERHGLTTEEILGPSRARRCAWPRHEAWALIWEQGRLSTTEIGRRFNRDHTTVLIGIRRHNKRLAETAMLA